MGTDSKLGVPSNRIDHMDGYVMNSTDIVGYTYDAAMHCVDCARTSADVGLLRREPPLSIQADQHGIAQDLIDREGNPVSPVFCGEDSYRQTCDDCGESLDGTSDEPEQHCIVDGQFGIYVPTRFAFKFRHNQAYCVLNVTPADWDELEKGPECKDYWELWDEIIQAAEIIDNETGRHYYLEQDEDLFLVAK